MKKNHLKTIAVFVFALLLGVSLFSCKGKDSNNNTTNPSSSRLVKYELTGTYSGTLILAYTNGDGVTQVEDKVKLPWSKEITAKSGYITVGVAASSETSGFGAAGETLTGKLSVGGVVKNSATVNSTSSGYIDLSTLYYIFY